MTAAAVSMSSAAVSSRSENSCVVPPHVFAVPSSSVSSFEPCASEPSESVVATSASISVAAAASVFMPGGTAGSPWTIALPLSRAAAAGAAAARSGTNAADAAFVF